MRPLIEYLVTDENGQHYEDPENGCYYEDLAGLLQSKIIGHCR